MVLIFLKTSGYREGFNILVYGLGSKRYLLDEFRTRSLDGKNVVVVNGYFPGLTIKEIFNSLTDGTLEHSGTFSSQLNSWSLLNKSSRTQRSKLTLLFTIWMVLVYNSAENKKSCVGWPP